MILLNYLMPRPSLPDKKVKNRFETSETFFVRGANIFFQKFGIIIARYPWSSLFISTLITIVASSIIPFTEMSNDVSDFTPSGARARVEIEAYKEFFRNKGEPIAIFVLVKSKSNNGNMLDLQQLEETVKLLDTISNRFKVYNKKTNREESFLELCNNFCSINEPVRLFYNGLLVKHNFGINSTSEHIDLSYPTTTVLGRQIPVDPNFFGVKVSILKNSSSDNINQKIEVVSVNKLHHSLNGRSMFDLQAARLKDNIREIKLIGLQFRIERPSTVTVKQLKLWEKEIINYLQNEFTSKFVEALILSEGFLTAEVVRAGLTLLPFLAIGFVIMVIFSSVTINFAAFYVSQLYPHKTILAFVACACPFMACGTALGALFWARFRFGSILCVTPFLILALGVDDAFLMINSWQTIRRDQLKNYKHQLNLSRASANTATKNISNHSTSLPIRPLQKSSSSFVKNKKSNPNVATILQLSEQQRQQLKNEERQRNVEGLLSAVMIDTGPSITITTLTNILAFSIGALTPTPEIQLFSVGNTMAILVDYIFEWTIFGAAMSIVGRWEFDAEFDLNNLKNVIELHTENAIKKNDLEKCFGKDINLKDDCVGSKNNALAKSNSFAESIKVVFNCLYSTTKQMFSRFVKLYCKLLSNFFSSFLIMLALVVYMYISIYGVLNMKAELKPEQLFLQSSDVIKALDMRNKYIIPFYAVCFVFVNTPVNVTNPVLMHRLHSLVSDFENLPSSVGQFSTKFWLRDYEKFMEEISGETSFGSENVLSNLSSKNEKISNEIRQFLNWPEFQFWHGFLQIEEENIIGSTVNLHQTKELRINKFFFTTASYGVRLKEWSQREKLLNQWRAVADMYPELNVSIYEDDAKFLDLIPAMIPQTAQSSFWTLTCMFLVCLIFIRHPTTLLVANFSIFSSCVGVFGILSLLRIDLDPIVMSSMIMSIGFSVDIPAHISYHFYKSGLPSFHSKLNNILPTVETRLIHCISAIGFPILEAGISTIICVSSLFFVNLHMANVFATTMILVVTIGLAHGLLVIPAMFYLISLFPTSGKLKSVLSSTKSSTLIY